MAESGFGRLDLAARRRVLVAVSGGGDSLALLHLLLEHLATSGLGTEPVVATVDHGLRAASASEAGRVAAHATELGLRHRVLHWHGPKPATGIMDAARSARYRLLAEAAREEDCDLVLTGHTLDDLAETVAMRQARGAQGAGLAGIAPATLYDGATWFARPLLDCRRDALRAWLSVRAIAWIEDPSNLDPVYERARVRAALSEAEVPVLAARAAQAAETRRALGEVAAVLLDEHASRPAPGLFRLDPSVLDAADRMPALLAFRVMLALGGGTQRLPDAERSGALLRRMATTRDDGAPLRVALSRALVERRRSGIWLRREDRAVPDVTIEVDTLWDGRWRVSPALGSGPVTMGPSRRGAVDPAGFDDSIPQALLCAALALEPAVHEGTRARPLRDEPPVRGVAANPVAAPFARLLSSFDLALAGAAHRLVGIARPGPPPFNDHNATGP